MGTDPSRISITERIDKRAFDPLALTQIQATILREYRVAYPLMPLFQGPCVENIAVEVQSWVRVDSLKTQRSHSTETTKSESNFLPTAGLSAISPCLFEEGFGTRVVCFHSMHRGVSFYPLPYEPSRGLGSSRCTITSVSSVSAIHSTMLWR